MCFDVVVYEFKQCDVGGTISEDVEQCDVGGTCSKELEQCDVGGICDKEDGHVVAVGMVEIFVLNVVTMICHCNFGFM